jgi:hypothetical protein
MEICLDENGFEGVDEKFFRLVGVNDRFFFISGSYKKDSHHSTIICLLNRENENKICKRFKCNFFGCFFYNAEVCVRFHVYGGGNMLHVYDIDESDSNEPSAILSGNIGEIAKVLASGNKYFYSNDITTSSYKQY